MNITKQLFLFVLALVCGLCQAQDELPTISADLDFQNFGKHHVISAGVAWLIN